MDCVDVVTKALKFRKNLCTTGLADSASFSKFNIPSGEKVLGYYECRYGLIGLGITKCIVFTENAIYLDPGAGKDNNSNNCRIPYENLCDYICEGADILTLHSRNNTLCIIKGSLIGAFSDVGAEIYEIIKYIDEKLVNSDADYASRKGRLFQDIVNDTEELIMAETYSGEKIDRQIAKIAGIGMSNRFAKEAITELTKLAVVLVNREFLIEACAIQQKNPLVKNDDVKNELEKQISSFLDLLKRYDVDINKGYEKVLSTNAEKSRKYSSDESTKNIHALFSSFVKKVQDIIEVRYSESIDDYYEGIVDDIPEDLAIRLVIKKAEELDQKMYTAYRMISSGFVVEPDEYPYIDSLGLEIIHYAILSKNYDQIDKCIKADGVLYDYSDDDSTVEDYIYDLSFLAWYVDDTPNHDLFVKVYTNLECMQSIMKVRKEMDLKLKFYNAALGAAGALQGVGHLALRKSEKALKKGTADFGYEEVEDYRYVVQDYDEELRYKREMYDMLFEDSQELYNEIGMCCAAAYDEIKDHVEELKSSDSKFIKTILAFFDSPGLIEQYLKESSGERHFGIHADTDIVCAFIDSFLEDKLGWKEWWNDEEFDAEALSDDDDEEFADEITVDKPYGEHWFSEKAHRSLKQMSKEYHILASKYHPDNNPHMLEAFLSIQEERAEIMSNIQ